MDGIGTLSPVDIREVRADEARDFSPWLAENVDLLGADRNPTGIARPGDGEDAERLQAGCGDRVTRAPDAMDRGAEVAREGQDGQVRERQFDLRIMWSLQAAKNSFSAVVVVSATDYARLTAASGARRSFVEHLLDQPEGPEAPETPRAEVTPRDVAL